VQFVTFQKDGRAVPGVLTGGQVADIQAAGFADVLSIIAGGAMALARVAAVLDSAPRLERSAVRLCAPIPRPPKIICVGLNYRDHAEESNMAIPETPTIFCKFPTAAIGPEDVVVLPKASSKPDYEAEFAVVIGQGGRHIAKENWLDHVFGYTILNDVSARDFQMATTQWVIGKTFDTFAPFGPAIVTKDEVSDPHQLGISLRLNGEVMQNSNTRNLIFDLPTLIAYLSSVFTLEPGDIISTGTPGGVGFARKPPVWLRPGDEMVVAIDGLGELCNRCVAES
jgi:2-keto-4-pentenoate hydratase/2-oxohepta-3-ene-1,7-dioic acid hydratase in catechol pathway